MLSRRAVYIKIKDKESCGFPSFLGIQIQTNHISIPIPNEVLIIFVLVKLKSHVGTQQSLHVPHGVLRRRITPTFVSVFSANARVLAFRFPLRRNTHLVTAQLSNSFSFNFGLDSQSLNSIESHAPSRLPWTGPVPGDIAEVEACCRIFRNSERLHSALMHALCNPITGECSVSYEVPSDEKQLLEDKIVSVLGCIVALVNGGRRYVLSGRSSIGTPFCSAEVGVMEDTLSPLALFRSEMKKCCESLHVALENYFIPGNNWSLDVWRKLQRLKNLCYDSGFPRGEDYPSPELFANWTPANLFTSKEDMESKESEAAFYPAGR